MFNAFMTSVSFPVTESALNHRRERHAQYNEDEKDDCRA